MKNNKKHEAGESKKHEKKERAGLMKGDYAKMESMMHGKGKKKGAGYKGR
jgi:hypothetical protein